MWVAQGLACDPVISHIGMTGRVTFIISRMFGQAEILHGLMPTCIAVGGERKKDASQTFVVEGACVHACMRVLLDSSLNVRPTFRLCVRMNLIEFTSRKSSFLPCLFPPIPFPHHSIQSAKLVFWRTILGAFLIGADTLNRSENQRRK